MPTSHVITMYIVNPATGELRLSPPSTSVDRGDKVSWIKDPKIESFQIIQKPGNNYNIFTKPLPGQVTNLELTVRVFAPNGDWNYSIIWIDAATHATHIFDPKISVKPKLDDFRALILFLLFTITCVSSVLLFRRKSKNK